MVQLVERSLLTSEVHGSNPISSKFYLLSNILKRRKKKKRPGMAHVFKNINQEQSVRALLFTVIVQCI